MPYRRAFSSLGCPELTLDETLDLADRHQIDAVELRALGGRLDLPKYLSEKFRNPSILAERMRTSPVQIVALDTSFRLVGHEPADREALLEFVPWAEALQIKYLRIFDGGTDAQQGDIDRARETMQWWHRTKKARGWTTDLMAETHDAFVTTAAIKRLLDVIPDLNLLWDAHHTWKKGGEDPLETWISLKTHIVHIHVKDSVSRPSPKHPFTYVPPGEGEFPAKPFFKRLSEEFRGPISLEWEKVWHPYLAPLDVALFSAQSKHWW